MRAASIAVVLVATTIGGGCSVRGLNFVQDERVEITQPSSRAKVSLPVTLAWDVEDFRVTGKTGKATPGAGYFAVFVDRSPQAAGRTIEVLARDDASCKVEPGCPDEAYFASRGVYTTESTELTIESIRDLSRDDRRDFHEATVVLLNGRGERIGESAFRVEFEIDREGE